MTASIPDSPRDPDHAAPPAATGRPVSAPPPEALIASAIGPTNPPPGTVSTRRRADFTSAVYGSVVAGTVIVTAGPARPVTLAIMIVVGGIVFWLAHVYALTVANVHGGWEFGAIRKGMRKEWPVAFAAIPPAIGALSAAVFPDISYGDGAWIALVIAIVEQQLWGYWAVRRSGMTGLAVVRTITLNVVIGIVVVVLKIAVGH
ncbi:hypothetical protein [Nakamurella sp.]|uniref:hypothetical protein n=1 Tax=Nakamurella sp. TaxID=1869182 RepID=UPI003784CBC6